MAGRLRNLVVDLSPLRNRQFRLWWTGQTISAVGTTLTRVAIPYEVYKLTGSSLWVGVLGGVSLVPYLAGGLIGGAIADAHDRRRISLMISVVSAVASAALALNAASADLVWMIFVLSVLRTAAQAVGSPASRSAVPLIVPATDLPSAAALQSVSYSVSFVLGPAIGGVLLGVIGLTGVYLVDALTFVAPLITWSLMKPLPPVEGAAPPSRASILEGLKLLRGKPVLIGAFVADLDAMIFGMPTALFPALVDQRFGGSETMLGLLAAAPFAGALVASVSSGWCKRIVRQGLAVCVCVAAWGVAIVGFGLVDTRAMSLLTLAIAGAADMISGVFRQSILQTATPKEMLGRMEGVGMAVWTSGPALGDLEAGGVAAVTSVDASVVIGGVGCVVGVGLIAALLPGFASYVKPGAAAGEALEEAPAPA
ncbi:MAG: MFS transporter [Acidimicrobiia bacterium]